MLRLYRSSTCGATCGSVDSLSTSFTAGGDFVSGWLFPSGCTGSSQSSSDDCAPASPFGLIPSCSRWCMSCIIEQTGRTSTLSFNIPTHVFGCNNTSCWLGLYSRTSNGTCFTLTSVSADVTPCRRSSVVVGSNRSCDFAHSASFTPTSTLLLCRGGMRTSVRRHTLCELPPDSIIATLSPRIMQTGGFPNDIFTA